MNFSRMDSSALIQRKQDDQASDGSVVTTWRDVTLVPARLEYLAGGKGTEANQPLGRLDAKITIRHHAAVAGVDSAHRLKIGTQLFEVVDALPMPAGRPDRIEIQARRIG